MKGKIVKISDFIGFIEYDIDKRISFNTNPGNISVGDIVEFDIVQSIDNRSGTTYSQAVIRNVVSKQKTNVKQTLRLSKVARNLNVGIHTIVKILHQHGYEVATNPNTKITEEQFQILEKHFSTKKDVKKKKILDEFERGTVIETQIEKIIYPSLLVLRFTVDKKAYLELRNLAWNIARAENTFNNLKENDTIQVVILENNQNHVVVSRKHLLPKPNETVDWKNLNVGQQLSGNIQEVLINSTLTHLLF